MPIAPRFSSLAFLIYSLADLCVFIYNLPYQKFFKFVGDKGFRGYQICKNITSVVFNYLLSLNYRFFLLKAYFTFLTIVYIILGNYNQVGLLLNRYDALEEEERKIAQGDFMRIFEHLKNKAGSRIEAKIISQEIVDEVVSSASEVTKSNLDMIVCNNAASVNGWEKEIEVLEKERYEKHEIEKKKDESGYFEEEDIINEY